MEGSRTLEIHSRNENKSFVRHLPAFSKSNKCQTRKTTVIEEIYHGNEKILGFVCPANCGNGIICRRQRKDVEFVTHICEL